MSFGIIEIEPILYSLALTFIIAQVVNSVLSMFNQRKLVFIISDKSAAIAAVVGERLQRGATFLNGNGAYTGREKRVLMTVVNTYQVKSLEEIAFQEDENAFMITYALLSKAGAPLPEPALPLIYILANLKWMGSFATFYAFGLAWPRDHWRGWLITVIMLAFPIAGLSALLLPPMVDGRAVFLLVGMPIFAWDFFARSRSETD